jgi:hypothetical protein
MRAKHPFDWSYLLLCPYMMVAYIPKVVLYFHHRDVSLMILAWLFVALITPRKIQLPNQGLKSLVGVIGFAGLYQGLGPFFWLFQHGSGLNYGIYSNFVLTVIPLLVFHFSVWNGRLRELRLLVIFVLVCIACSAAMTFMGLQDLDIGARVLTGASNINADLYTIRDAFEAGIGSYGHIYGMGLLIFPIMYCAKFMPVLMKILVAGLVFMFLMTVYRAAFSILMIGLFLAGLLYLVTRLGVRLGVLKIVGAVAVAVFVTVVANPEVLSFLNSPLQRLGEMTNRMEYQSRIDSILDMISGDQNTYASFRASLYWKSWRIFLKKPFFGIGNYHTLNSEMLDAGGHSMVFDTLAVWGIFGLSVYILIFVNLHRYMRVMSTVALGEKWWPAYYLFLIPFSLIAFINPIGGAIILSDIFLIIPSLAFFFKSRGPVMGGRPLTPYPQQLRQPANISNVC